MFFHLDCVPRDKETGEFICRAKLKSLSQEDYCIATSHKMIGATSMLSMGATRGFDTAYRWYCPRHECCARDCAEQRARDAGITDGLPNVGAGLLRVSSLYNRRHIYCLRCPRMAHALCATEERWIPIPDSDRFAICSHHSASDLTLPWKLRRFLKPDECLAPAPEWVSKYYIPSERMRKTDVTIQSYNETVNDEHIQKPHDSNNNVNEHDKDDKKSNENTKIVLETKRKPVLTPSLAVEKYLRVAGEAVRFINDLDSDKVLLFRKELGKAAEEIRMEMRKRNFGV